MSVEAMLLLDLGGVTFSKVMRLSAAVGPSAWCGGVVVWLSVAVWSAAALAGVLLSFWTLCGGMVLTLSGEALGDDAFLAAVGSSVTVGPSVAVCGSPELTCEPPCLIR